MYARLQRQNSFGPKESKSTLVISRIMELKILEGESYIPNASPIVLEAINNSLQSLIDSCDSKGPVICELPEFVKNYTISRCDLSEKELIDKRYSEYFEGYSLANNVQYIPVEIECLSKMSNELCKSILALFVSIVFEYISDDNNLKENDLIKWGSIFLQRIGNFLGLSELEITSIIKPVSENLELKQLGMNFDDLILEKQIHVDFIKEQLAPMQENINDFFKQTVGALSDEDFENDINDLDPFKAPDKKGSYSERRSSSFDKTSGYADTSFTSTQKTETYGQTYDESQYAQSYQTDYNQDYNEHDFDMLLNDDGEVDDEEASFRKNFIDTYNKDTKYTFDNDKYDSLSGNKSNINFHNAGNLFDDLLEPDNKPSEPEAQYSNPFDEFTEPPVKHSEPDDYGVEQFDDLYNASDNLGGPSTDPYEFDFKANEASPVAEFSEYGTGFSEPGSKHQESYSYEPDSEDDDSYDENLPDYDENLPEYDENLPEYDEQSYDENLPDYDEESYDEDLPEYDDQTYQEEPSHQYDDQTYEEEVPQQYDEPVVVDNQPSEPVEFNPTVQQPPSDNQRDDLNNLLTNFLTNDSSIDAFNVGNGDDLTVFSQGQNRDGSQADIDNKTDVEDNVKEKEGTDLLKDLDESHAHMSSLPADDVDSLLHDMSNMNLPPKKNKSLFSKISSNISKKINRVFSINSEKSSKMTPAQSINSGSSSHPHHDYLSNLVLEENSPDIVAVLVRNLVLKYIINGYNDSRGQAIFGLFGNLLGVTSGSLLSIENNMVSDLVGIMDMNAAKTTSKKMSKRLKILSATVGGTALLALTAGVASPVLAVGVVFLGLSGTGVSTYLSSSEGTNILKNMFGINVSLTHFKAKRDLLSNLQFIQLNPTLLKDTMKEHEPSMFSLKEGSRLDSIRDRDDSNNNYIGICVCVGNNIFLNEIFFFENNSVDFKSSETNRHLDSEYIDIWKRQFPVPINDMYLLKWESKLLASLHRMLLKLKSLSIYDKCMELYRTYNDTLYTTHLNYSQQQHENDNLLSFDVRDSSGAHKHKGSEGSSGNYYSGGAPRNGYGDGSQPVRDPQRRDLLKDFKTFHNDVRTINWPVGLVQLCSNLDNCWLVCRNRAETCGALLANAICDKMLTGDRHISLVGYSMGARVIFYCLLALFEKNKINTVKDVVLMGLPSTAGHNEWSKCSSVVSGRLINVYNENDWVLAFLYRYTSNYKVAGLAPVVHEKVENFNATNLFTSHVEYLENISKIAAHLNIQL